MAEASNSPQWFDGIALACLVVVVTAAERFDRALAEVETYGDQVVTGWLRGGWIVTAVVGVAIAIVVGCRLIVIAQNLNADPDRLAALRWLVGFAVAVWAAWQATGIAILYGNDVSDGLRAALHVAALLLAIAAVGWAGGAVAGNAMIAWRRASVVRLQLILLGALGAAMLFLPIASDQCLDVLRAWGDGPYARVVVGIAAALLLGAVCRASAERLLLPADDIQNSRLRRVTIALVGSIRRALRLPDPLGRHAVVVAAGLVVTAALWLGGFRPAAVALAGYTLLAVLTRWDDAIREPAAAHPSLRRLAGTLGVVPRAIVLAGLASATIDSLLLPSGPSASDAWLIGTTVFVFIVFALLAADAHTAGPPGASSPKVVWIVVLAVLAALGGLVPGTLVAGRGVVDGIAASCLLVAAAILAARRLPRAGAPELWVGWAVVAGSIVAVYAKPVEASRALGTFGLVFIAATGILLVLHAAGSVGARRSFRPQWSVLPQRAPVVLLLGVWIAAAFVLRHDTVHQTRVVATTAEPVPFRTALREWLREQAAHPVGDGDNAYVPLLLVGASGGGSKAAYWTDLVADCVFGVETPGDDGECSQGDDASQRYSRLFLTSSVSGGSVGVRHLIAYHDRMLKGETWVDPAAGTESLSPVTGWGLYHDLPAFLLGPELDPRDCKNRWPCRWEADRALVQEVAVAGGEVDDGLLAQGDGPVTVFNASEDGAARRILLSNVQLAPWPRRRRCPAPRTGEPINTAVDANDVLGPGLDVPLITAAFVSARFPAVEPPARLGDAPDVPQGCDPPKHLRPMLARDGGYVENSGLLTIVELLPAIRAELAAFAQDDSELHRDADIRVVVLSIDDDPLKLAEEDPENAAPGGYGIGSRAGPALLTATARYALDNCAFDGVSSFRVSPPRRIGAKAATGWEISQTTREEDLEEALVKGPARDTVERVRSILKGEATPDGCDWRYD